MVGRYGGRGRWTVHAACAALVLCTLSACSISHQMDELSPLEAAVGSDSAALGGEASAIDEYSCEGRRIGEGASVRWFGPHRNSDRARLAAWCSAVGPVEWEEEPDVAPPPTSDSTLIVVTWNTHVGGGDVVGFLRSELGYECDATSTDGATRHFVVLTQEVHRSSKAVPVRSEDAVVPDRIARHPRQGPRLDIVQVARRCGLSLFYVPSMRNGFEEGEGGREDRGSAILSTLPLSDPVAIELPFEAQRRVTPVATILGPGGWRLRVASVHYDVAGNILRVLGTGGSMRVRQNDGQTEALDWLDPERDLPIVVAGDLNTWSYRETVIQRMLETYPDSPDPGREKTRGDWPPDHLFFRAGSGRLSLVEGSYRVVPDYYGSDHKARVALLVLR